MVWGLVEGAALSPGLVCRWTEGKPTKYIRNVVWFGDGLVSKVRVQTVDLSCINSSYFKLSCPLLWLQVHPDGLQPYAAFAQCFCPHSFATSMTYKNAIFHSLQVRFSITLYAAVSHQQLFFFTYCLYWCTVVGSGSLAANWQAQELQFKTNMWNQKNYSWGKQKCHTISLVVTILLCPKFAWS